MNKEYDVVIVGAGPAGLFAALDLGMSGKNVLLVDKGPSLAERRKELGKSSVKPFGFGGAGTGSDGKIIFSTMTGGCLNTLMPEVELSKWLNVVKGYWDVFIEDAPVGRYYNTADLDLAKRAAANGVELITSDIIHTGSDLLPIVLGRLEKTLYQYGVEILMDTEVVDIKPRLEQRILLTNRNELDRGQYVVALKDYDCWVSKTKAKCVIADNIIFAPGRGGAKWLSGIADKFGIEKEDNFVDIGVRVEVPASVTREVTDKLYEFKMKHITQSYMDVVRTFCCNPNGYVVQEKYNDCTLVNGHSNRNSKSENTNFALLSSIKLGPPISKALEFSENIIRTTNSIADGVLVQRLGDLLDCHRTKSLNKNTVIPTLDANPGDLSLAYPARFVINIIEGLQAIDNIIPGIFQDDTLLYAPEVKMYSSRIKVDKNMESSKKGVYFCGDGVGLSRGIAQACVCGLLAAEGIIKGD